jgi:Uma2 family endonuclease
MFTYNLLDLPPAEELPDSDDMPVDDDLQIYIPLSLRQSLSWHWRDRADWYFGINMGIYYHGPGFNPRVPLVPDGFLSLGVNRFKDHPEGRPSYIVWLEQDHVPLLILECVSHIYRGEYDDKMTCYRQMGVLYYLIYNPQRYHADEHTVLEVYRRVKGQYRRQRGPRFWLPELDLFLGREVGQFGTWEHEWLYWYDSEGRRLPTHEERAERLAALLRAHGLDPDQLS